MKLKQLTGRQQIIRKDIPHTDVYHRVKTSSVRVSDFGILIMITRGVGSRPQTVCVGKNV